MIIHNSALADFGFPHIGDLSAFGGAGPTQADQLALVYYDNALGYYRSQNPGTTPTAIIDALHQYADYRANWSLQPLTALYNGALITGDTINQLGAAAGLPVQFVSSAAATAAATPSQNIFNQIAALVKTAASAPGKLPGQIASDLSSDVSSVVAKAMNIGGFAGQTIQGIIQLNAALGTMASAISRAILSGDRTKIAAALRDSDPMQNGSTMYHLINDPQNEDAADILSAVVFSPLIAALCFNPADPNFGAAIENLTARPSPYTDILRDISTIAAQGMVGPTLVQKLSDIGTRLIQVVIGLPVGPATAFTVGILIATNLPQPPYMAIITKIINDPVAKKYMSSRGISPLIVKKLIPDTIACMDAETPQQWVQCAEGVIDVVAPKLITNLKNHGVNFNDVKNIAAAAWDSGLDLDLMTDDDVYPGIDASWIALGVVGLVYIAQAAKIPTNTVIGKYFAVGNEKNVAKMIQQGLHFFETAVGVDEPFTNYDDAVQNPKTFTQKFMDAMKQMEASTGMRQ